MDVSFRWMIFYSGLALLLVTWFALPLLVDLYWQVG